MLPDRSQIVGLLQSAHPFRKLPADQLEILAAYFQPALLAPGQIIYRQGDASDHYYLITHGQVTLTRSPAAGGGPSTLGSGDGFGVEAGQKGSQRVTTAVAAVETGVLRLSRQRLKVIFHRFPGLRLHFNLLERSQDLSAHLKFSWRISGEHIYLAFHRHVFFLWRKIIWPVFIFLALIPFFTFLILTFGLTSILMFLSLTAFLGLAGWFSWEILDWGNDYYIITNRRIVNHQRVILLYDSRQEVPLESILSISTVTENWFQRRFHYGTILVRTFTGTMRLTRIPHPESFASMLEDTRIRSRTRRSRVNKELIADNLRRKLGLGPDVPLTAEVQQTPPVLIKPGWLQSLLSHYFQLRQVRDNSIIYRTHWYILFKRELLPTFLLLLWAALLIARWVTGFSLFAISMEIAVGALTLLGLCILWWYRYSDWHNDTYMVTDREIIDSRKKPLAEEIRQAAPLKNIQSVEFQRLGIPALIFNFGTVFIRVGDTQLQFVNVHNPTEVQREISMRLTERGLKDALSQEESEYTWMGEYLEAYHQVTRQPPPES